MPRSDWTPEQGEGRWSVWIDRVILNYSCATRTNFQDLTLDPATEVEPMPEMSSQEAIEMLQEYTKGVAAAGLDGTSVLDASRLAHPKEQIKTAVAVLIAASGDPEERASIAEAARALAFFQPGVGEAKAALDASGPDGQTWGDIVRAEMQSLEATLLSAP